jgi:hypothetical protein
MNWNRDPAPTGFFDVKPSFASGRRRKTRRRIPKKKSRTLKKKYY